MQTSDQGSGIKALSPRLNWPDREIACPRCGAGFRCGPAPGAASQGCWCVGLPVLARRTGEDCFCPDCLRKAIREQR
jgi:uncharacterized protein